MSSLFLTRVKADEAPVEPDPTSIRARFAAGLRFAAFDPIIRPTLLAAGPIGRRLGVGPAHALGCVLFPAPLILIPLVSGPPEVIFGALMLAEFGAGLGVMILDVKAGSIILARTPDRIRARATGAFRTLNYGIRPIGAFLGGVLGTAIGVQETLLVVTVAPLLGVPVASRVAGDPPARASRIGRV